MVGKSVESELVLLIKTRPKDRLKILMKLPFYRRPIVLLSLSHKLRENLLKEMIIFHGIPIILLNIIFF